jgi:hypothetical protein
VISVGLISVKSFMAYFFMYLKTME